MKVTKEYLLEKGFVESVNYPGFYIKEFGKVGWRVGYYLKTQCAQLGPVTVQNCKTIEELETLISFM